MSDFTLTIDGRAVAGDTHFDVLNPATEEVFARAPECTPEQLDLAVAAAGRAFPAWSALSLDERRGVLLEMAKRVDEHHDELAEILQKEQGKSLENAHFEVGGAAMWLRLSASLELPVEVLEESDEQRIEAHYKPLGVVGAITPWNFPLLLSIWKVGPALVAGNTMVLKPSPYTPLTCLHFGEVVRDVVPAGVLNVVSGGDGLGKLITDHPDVQKISFTGSGPTGKKVMASAAGNLKRVTLELGGNDPAIVLPDVDPAAVARPLFQAAFMNSGQVCGALKRLYVHEDVHDALCAALVEEAGKVTVGNGAEEGVDLGPVQNEMQYRRVCELAEDAKATGGRFLVGGEPLPGPGYFFPVTLVAGLSDGSRLVDEEPFGPILPVIAYRDVDDAVARANASPFGLGGSVWTADVERGAELAARLECGSAWVNQHFQLSPTMPFGGVKESGMGCENGTEGLKEFTARQVIYIPKG